MNILTRLRSGVLLLLCLCVPAWAQPALIRDLPVGTWIEVPNSKLKTATNTTNGVTTQVAFPWPAGSQWGAIQWGVMTESGATYDEKHKYLMLWGGGHGDYAGNEIYAFNLTTLQWIRLNDPTLNTDARNIIGTSGYYPTTLGGNIPDLQQPRSGHTYQTFQYIPTLGTGGQMCAYGVPVGFPGVQSNLDETICWDLDMKVWVHFPPEDKTKKPYPGIGGTFIYDAVHDKAYAFGTIIRAWFSQWDPHTNVWTKLKDVPELQYDYHRTATYDSDTNKIIVINGCNAIPPNMCGAPEPAYMMNLNTTPVTKEALSTTGSGIITTTIRNPGVFYYRPLKKVITWNGGTDLYYLDVPTQTWEKIPAAATNTVNPGASKVRGTYGRFFCDADWGLCGVVNEITTSVFLVRVSPPATPPPPPPPPPADTTAPLLTVTSPMPDQVVSGLLTLQVSATDAGSVPTVAVTLDGVVLPGLEVDTLPLANGRHTLVFTATDASGNVSSQSVPVLVLNCAACVAPVVIPPPAIVTPPVVPQQGTRVMPSLDDERATYRRYGWTWQPSQEPHLASAYAGMPQAGKAYTVVDPNIHDDTEGDDLWTYLQMWKRTGQAGYKERAEAWVDYYKTRYLQCTGGKYNTYCFDKNGYTNDHLYGQGLLAWVEEHPADTAALQVVIDTATDVETIMKDTRYKPGYRFGFYGLRLGARWLHVVSELARVTHEPRWLALRDRLVEIWMASPDWDATYGMYWLSDYTTNSTDLYGPGTYEAGVRAQSAFQIGLLSEALFLVYQQTHDPRLKDKLIKIARYVQHYGLDPAQQYTSSYFGVNLTTGLPVHKYTFIVAATGQYLVPPTPGATPPNPPGTYVDPNYTTSLVNPLVIGYKLTGDATLLDSAKVFFNRGTKGVYGTSVKRSATDNVVDHFLDTVWDTSQGNFYLRFKGELQYAYHLFEGGGSPPLVP